MVFRLLMELAHGEISFPILLLELIYSVAALLLVFPVHECAHGLVACAFGDRTAKEQGRLTLNPFPHIDARGFILLLLLGFGWAKPVQVNPMYFRKRRLGMICTAAAGPLSNVLFCLITYLIYGILSVTAVRNNVEWLLYFSILFEYMAIYNATFAVFNLIPIPPLDGSKILGELLPFKLRYRYYNLERYSFFLFIALILVLNSFDFVSLLANGLLKMFTPMVTAVLGGIFG